MAINPPFFILFLLTLPWLGKVYLSGLDFLHILQLEGYKNEGFSKWIKSHRNRIFPRREKLYGIIIFLGGSVVWLVEQKKPALYSFFALWLVLVLLLIFRQEKRKVKKALVYTKRAIRLLGCYGGVFLLEITILLLFLPLAYANSDGGIIANGSVLFLWSIFILGIMAPYNLMLANILIRPLEERINAGYFRKAQQEVGKIPALTVVGITGSYGKTSTKMIAHAVLSADYKTLTTPESYNTPMGICKVINAELTSGYQYFVVEMGARYRGDIRELCRLTPPRIGILTTITKQHLETFGTAEAIYETKKELADALPSNGILIINGDDPNCRRVAESVSLEVISFGIEQENLDFRASRIKTSPQGIRFTVETGREKSFEVKARLLGKHNVYNLLAGIALGFACQIKPRRIASALARLNPIPHRLQLRKSSGGATVIDDAYNANPVGAAKALEVLSEFRQGRKILVTPGFVEMGEDEEKQNRELGKQAAAVCDRVFLVGRKKTEAIRQGLMEAGFTPSKIEVVDNLDQVTEKLINIAGPDDVILFENDLPDQYSEPA